MEHDPHQQRLSHSCRLAAWSVANLRSASFRKRPRSVVSHRLLGPGNFQRLAFHHGQHCRQAVVVLRCYRVENQRHVHRRCRRLRQGQRQRHQRAEPYRTAGSDRQSPPSAQQAALLQVAYESEYWHSTCTNCGVKMVVRQPKDGGGLFWAVSILAGSNAPPGFNCACQRNDRSRPWYGLFAHTMRRGINTS